VTQGDGQGVLETGPAWEITWKPFQVIRRHQRLVATQAEEVHAISIRQPQLRDGRGAAEVNELPARHGDEHSSRGCRPAGSLAVLRQAFLDADVSVLPLVVVDGIQAVTAIQQVDASAPVEDVVALLAVSAVGAGAAHQHIVPLHR